MQGVIRLVFFGYLVSLTVLLLVKDPLRLMGMRGEGAAFLDAFMPFAHLLSFFLLTALALIIRWPIPRWIMAILLAMYGGLTEIAQSFLPPRTAEWRDWLQDLAGIAIGAVVCWGLALAAGALAGSGQKPGERVPSATCDEWTIVRTVMSRPTARGQSWWG
jgi:VanZ family protein